MPPIPTKKPPIPSDDFEGIRYENGVPKFYFSLKAKETIRRWEMQRLEMMNSASIARSVKSSGTGQTSIASLSNETPGSHTPERVRNANGPSSSFIPSPRSVALSPTIVQNGAVPGQTASTTGNVPSSPQNLSTERKSAKETASPKPIQQAATTETIKGVEITRKGEKCTVFGFPTSRIIQWMGSKGWTSQQVYRVMKALKLTGVSDTSVELLRKVGAKGKASPVFKEITLSIKQRNLLTAVSEG